MTIEELKSLELKPETVLQILINECAQIIYYHNNKLMDGLQSLLESNRLALSFKEKLGNLFERLERSKAEYKELANHLKNLKKEIENDKSWKVLGSFLQKLDGEE